MTHSLTVPQWRTFFLLCADILGPGDIRLPRSKSFCAWTVFTRLEEDLHYWQSGLPHKKEIDEAWITDGGTWGQPFSFDQLAHVIIPRKWGCEHPDKNGNPEKWVVQTQEIDALSAALKTEGIDHRLTDLILEVRCF
ncbi:hypothetical protein [Sphingobium sp. WCS2017Hpa-17]|uniref:hypothetical protein n=1 Tax=Sphingobium sp. WCS2017Hpa-17 TaxID=3073638 RepID=UPI002889A302|nr:hypothetical protein [Sphingobium sp. WCS2017Hpa-17]